MIERFPQKILWIVLLIPLLSWGQLYNGTDGKIHIKNADSSWTAGKAYDAAGKLLDSLNTKINADSLVNYVNSRLAPMQDDADTSTWDATRYWTDLYFMRFSDSTFYTTPYANSLKLNSAAIDTSKVVFWADSANELATNYDVSLKANLASPTFTGTVTIPTPFTIGAVSMTATGTELNCSVGVTSAIQTQLNAKVTASRTDTMWVNAFDMWPSTTNGCAALSKTETGTTNIQTLDFDKDAIEYAEFDLQLDGWDGGTINFIFYWTTKVAATASTVCQWAAGAKCAADGGLLNVAWSGAVGVGDTYIGAGKLHISAASGACTVGGTLTTGNMMLFYVWRNATHVNDTVNVDACLLIVAVIYTRTT